MLSNFLVEQIIGFSKQFNIQLNRQFVGYKRTYICVAIGYEFIICGAILLKSMQSI